MELQFQDSSRHYQCVSVDSKDPTVRILTGIVRMQGGDACRHGLLLCVSISEEQARAARRPPGSCPQQPFRRSQRDILCELRCSKGWCQRSHVDGTSPRAVRQRCHDIPIHSASNIPLF